MLGIASKFRVRVGGLMRHSRGSRRSFRAKSYHGAARPMKMGTNASPCPYDAAACQFASPRETATACDFVRASPAAVFRYGEVDGTRWSCYGVRSITKVPTGGGSIACYGFRLGRRLNGSRTATPEGSKSDTLRVTTVSPCSSAVAAIMRSALSLPRAALRAPQRRAVRRSNGTTRSP